MGTLNNTVRYVAKVLRSCETEEQLNNGVDWAVSVIAAKAKECRKQPVASRGKSHKRLIPPRVEACRLCEGRGYQGEAACEQCGGSGRVIVSSDVETFVKAYRPTVAE